MSVITAPAPQPGPALGGDRMSFAFDGALLTLDSALGAEAAKTLGARRVVPVHYDSRAHFQEGRPDMATASTPADLTDCLDFARQPRPNPRRPR